MPFFRLQVIPGILFTLTIKLAPPVWAGLKAQLQQQAIVVRVFAGVDVVLLEHCLVGL